jgi:hypothetical protein
MGSTRYGNVIPLIGLTLPQHVKINRDGNCRVRCGGRA